MEQEDLQAKWKTVVENIETETLRKTFSKSFQNLPQETKLPTIILPFDTLEGEHLGDTLAKETLPSDKTTLASPSPLNTTQGIEEVPTTTLGISQYPTKNELSLPTQKPNFEIIEEIARGGMGVVYKGRQNNLDRNVAIKKLLDSVFPEDVSKFVAESKVTAFLDHPNIVPVYDLGQSNTGETILIMKLVGGTSWKDSLDLFHQQENYLAHKDFEKQLRILLSVCYAVDFAHSKGIVHNDLKPENVMIGEFGEVLVMDWGISVYVFEKEGKEALLHKSMVESPMGTPCYMSPELAEGRGKDLGPWTDVYLLGAILYEILTKKTPHRGHNLITMLYSICYEDNLEFSAEIPEELQKLCRKALAKKIPERYQNITEFKEELENFLQHRESILITQESTELLESCDLRASKLKEASNTERNRLYDDFAQTIASFHQALKLWPENERAAKGEKKARKGFAQTAIKNDDFGLAEAQAECLKDSGDDSDMLMEEIKSAKEENFRTQIMYRLSQICFFMICILLFRVITSTITYLKGIRDYLLLNNHPLQIFIFGLFFVFTVGFTFLILKKKFPPKELLKFAILYEVVGVSLVSLAFFIIPMDAGAKPTGVYPTALMILIFAFLIPYPKKLSIFIGGVCFLALLLVLLGVYLAGNPFPPTMIVGSYLAQHILIAIIGVLLSSVVGKSSNAPSSFD